MSTGRFALVVGIAGVIIAAGILVSMLIDGAISLTHARVENSRLRAKCELLARLADEGLRGRPVDDVVKVAGANVLAKIEGEEFSLDDVLLRVKSGKVEGVDVVETCGSLEK